MTEPRVRLCLVLHNHQPVGNFEDVFEQAYRDSYLPFLDAFESYEDLRLALHTSGSLMEWLDRQHAEYVDRLAALVAAGRIEIIGGPFFEPILTMLPPRDRVGQILQYSRWLTQRLGATVRGAWVPERVWEASLASDFAAADIEYVVLDDCHFRNAGLAADPLHGYYVTEDSGRLLKIFPGSERLRYLIPFGAPEQTIDLLRGVADRSPGSVVTFGDDGEKFGTWPETKLHVYERGWLRRFFEALSANRDWLATATLAETVDRVVPTGKIYLPDASYREMTEWVLPVERQLAYHSAIEQLRREQRWELIQPFVRGGFWRNYKVRYAEANEMYSRMMYVSDLLQQHAQEVHTAGPIDAARQHLYRGQCNCAYWHGAFGGLYLPHLRNAVYRELIAAENQLEQAAGRKAGWVEATADDYNFDARTEIRLAGDRLVAWLEPAAGGRMYELDVRAIQHNLLATLCRRPEAYHEKVRAGDRQHEGGAASIHDRVVFKQQGLEQRLQYDRRLRKSLIDHFWPADASLDQVALDQAHELGDFADGVYQSRIRRNPDRVQVQLVRQGHCGGHRLTITKGVTLSAASDELEIAYWIEGLPADRDLHFGVEFNFAGLPSRADDRYFHTPIVPGHRLPREQAAATRLSGAEPLAVRQAGTRLGQLQTQLDLREMGALYLRDEWLGIDVGLTWDRPTAVWTFPLETVSQSEGGFELVHQSVVVIPHWRIRGDARGRWSTVMRLILDTTLAESRGEPSRPADQKKAPAQFGSNPVTGNTVANR
jgi:alpha-amylase